MQRSSHRVLVAVAALVATGSLACESKPAVPPPAPAPMARPTDAPNTPETKKAKADVEAAHQAGLDRYDAAMDAAK